MGETASSNYFLWRPERVMTMEGPTINHKLLKSRNHLLNFMLLYLEILIFFLAQHITFLCLKYLFWSPLDSAARSCDATLPTPNPTSSSTLLIARTVYNPQHVIHELRFSLRTAKRPPLPAFKGTTSISWNTRAVWKKSLRTTARYHSQTRYNMWGRKDSWQFRVRPPDFITLI